MSGRVYVGLATGAVGVAPGRQARGSQGWRFDVVGEAVAIAATVGVVVVVVVLTVPGELGALTVNWEPVTTVT